MLYVSLLILSLVIVYFSFHLTEGNKKNRIIFGVVLILSIFTYPLTFTLIIEIKPELDAAGFLILFHLILLLSGVIAVVLGVFTKNKLNENNKIKE